MTPIRRSIDMQLYWHIHISPKNNSFIVTKNWSVLPSEYQWISVPQYIHFGWCKAVANRIFSYQQPTEKHTSVWNH